MQIWCLILVILGGVGVRLCLWQWHKAEAKMATDRSDQVISSISVLREQMGAIHLSDLHSMEKHTALWLGKPVAISGYFIDRFVGFLDNQIVNGAPGVDVIGLFQLDSGGSVIVNRGWIPWAERDYLPDISHPTQHLSLTGVLYPFSSPGLKLGNYPELKSGRPARLPWVDPQALQTFSQLSLAAVEVRLDGNQSTAFQPHWQLSVIPPAKHRAYAWQWAALTLLTWGYALWIYRKIRTEPDN